LGDETEKLFPIVESFLVVLLLLSFEALFTLLNKLLEDLNNSLFLLIGDCELIGACGVLFMELVDVRRFSV
jgi:hypothetical protein